MSLSDKLSFEPVRFSTALNVFGVAVIGLLGILFVWTPLIIGAVMGIWAGAKGVFDSFIVRGSVTSNANVEQVVHDTIVALSPMAPGPGA